MTIKVNTLKDVKHSAITSASVAVSPAVGEGSTGAPIAQVIAHVSMVDYYNIGHVLAGLRLHPEEARRLSVQLAHAADEAERMLAKAVR